MRTATTVTLALVLLLGTTVVSGQESCPSPPSSRSSTASSYSQDRAGIERLHRQDVAATLSGHPEALANLFSEDGVLMEPGSPAIVGRAAILASNEQDKAQHPEQRDLSYKPEICNLQIENGWAFEWDYFDASFSESPKAPVQIIHAKALRVLRREPDGSWKFARVMWNLVNTQPNR
jgi:uncharacterized protein (TIGR02246 family)